MLNNDAHPSYGALSVERKEADYPVFGASVKQSHCVRLTITEASLRAGLVRQGKVIVAVELSPAGLASALFGGDGEAAPCSIRVLDGQEVRPAFPVKPPESRALSAYRQAQEELLAELEDRAEKFSLSLRAHRLELTKKERHEFADRLEELVKVARGLGPALAESFRKTVEEIVEEEVPSFVRLDNPDGPG